MFKKNILALSLSIAMTSSYAVNAMETPQPSITPEAQQEIVKYSEVIDKLKVDLKEKEDYNILLQSKLNTAVNLVKTLEPEKVGPEKIKNLNALVLTLTQKTQENDINNKELDKKIKKLEAFLAVYKDNQSKGVEKQSENVVLPVNADKPLNVSTDSKAKVEIATTNGISNDVIEANKKLEEQNEKTRLEQEAKNKTAITNNEISKDVIEANKALLKKNEELRIEQDKKNSIVTPEKISFEEPSPKEINNIENKVEPKTTKANVPEKDAAIPDEEKTFMQAFEEKIEKIAIWFKKLFGIEDNLNKDEAPIVVEPSQIEMQMKKDKLASILKEKEEQRLKEEQAKKELEEKNKDIIKIDETPVHLEDKVIKNDNVTPIDLAPEYKAEIQKDSSEINSVNDVNINVDSNLNNLEENSSINKSSNIEDSKNNTELPTVIDQDSEKQTDDKQKSQEAEDFIKDNEIISSKKDIPMPTTKDTNNGDMIILKAQKPTL
jgi:hypothetical protein